MGNSKAPQTIGRHFLLCLSFVLLYVFLSSPSIIVVSRLGFTVWFPAVGLVLSLFLGLSPWYVPLAALCDVLVGTLIYHQPVLSWSETVATVGSAGCYGLAAYVLRGPLRIDLGLRHRSDVVRYVFVTLCAAIGSTGIGVAALAADHTIPWNQYWSSAAGWYAGDATGLLGFAPFLLIHVLPVVRRRLLGMDGGSQDAAESKIQPRKPRVELIELAAQFLSIPATLWFVFAGPFAHQQLYYLAYLPIIWIAMRHGIRHVVTSLVVFNFGIVVALRFFPVTSELVTKVGFLMLVVSAVGLIVGSTVTERHRIGRQLNERTMYLDSLIQNTPLGIVVRDREGRVQLCNDAFEALFLYRRGELLGKNIDAFIVPHDQEEQARQFVAAVGSGQRVQASIQRKRKDGALMDLELYAAPLIMDGEVSAALAIYADVTERMQVALKLKDHADALKRSVDELQERTTGATLLNEMGDLLQSCESSTEATAVVAEFGGKLFPSASLGALFVFKSSRNALEIESKWGRAEDLSALFPPDNCWALRKGQPHWSDFPNGKIVCSHSKGGLFLDLCVPMMARGETLGILHLRYDRVPVVSSATSVEVWQQSQKLLATSVATQIALAVASLRLRESLRDQSIRDPLTGLFNRRFMQESLDREMQRAGRKGRPVSVAFIDIDHFKRFNDAFGHDAGDTVLRSIADLMRTFFRADDVICRFGGEEFALILPESSERDAALRMTEFGAKVKTMTVLHQGRVLDHISVSVGVAAFPRHGSSIEALLQAADQALYLSKTQGRARVSVAE